MGAKIYGATTIGPYSKVGGEVQGSVFFGYSNKGHDGYLGNSVIAEWCNLGAGTNNSNLKNNYSNCKNVGIIPNRIMWTTGLQFCGLLYGRSLVNPGYCNHGLTPVRLQGVSRNYFRKVDLFNLNFFPFPF